MLLGATQTHRSSIQDDEDDAHETDGLLQCGSAETEGLLLKQEHSVDVFDPPSPLPSKTDAPKPPALPDTASLLARRCPRLASACETRVGAVVSDTLLFLAAVYTAMLLNFLVCATAAGWRLTPKCGLHCTERNRGKELVWWQRPNATAWYGIPLGLICPLLYIAFGYVRWVHRCGRPRWVRSCRLLALIPFSVVVTNHGVWDPIMSNLFMDTYIDWDPNVARADAYRPTPTLTLLNGSTVTAGTGRVVVVGNGPLSTEQRAFIRASDPRDIFRFNGMANMLPDEPVGHLFARRADDATAQYGDQHLHEFSGLQPPLSVAGLTEWLISPRFATNHMRTRSMCHRVDEARSVSLLFGTSADASTYMRRLHLPVVELPFENDSLVAALKATGIEGETIRKGLLDGHTFSSGLLGILEVLRIRPGQPVHILGMNFAASAQDHMPDLEYAVVRKLVTRGRATIHPPPSNLYRAVARIKSSWFMHDVRVQGLSCGAWNHWWWAQWRFKVNHWFLFFPVSWFMVPPEVELPELPNSTDADRRRR